MKQIVNRIKNINNINKMILIIVITILLFIIGTTYAYFAGQIGPGATTNVNLTSKTVDNLTFTTGSDITIGPVTQANFAQGSGNKSGSTTAQAILRARSDASATYYYRVYLLISDNDFEYTSGTTPELKLNITKNGTTIINNQDITTTTGIIEIPSALGGSNLKQTISANAGAITTDTWQVTVTFVNLNSDQSANGGKTFKAMLYIENAPELPSGFQEVEYIENTGGQIINTGIKPAMNKIRCVCDVVPLDNKDNAFFGSRGTYYLFYNISGNYFWPTSRAESIEGTLNVGNKYHVDWNKGTLDVIGANRVHQHAVRSNNTQDQNDMYLFNFNPLDSTRQSISRLYYFKIYVEDELVRNFVPCYRKSDSVIGMYDTVNGVFYTNAGSGTFAKGNNIT